jgi:hypothetical protein
VLELYVSSTVEEVVSEEQPGVQKQQRSARGRRRVLLVGLTREFFWET